MGSTYNPLLGEDPQPRSRGRRHAPELGVALVVQREGRPLMVLADPTDRLTAGETWWANIKTVHRVDTRDHQLEFEEQLPCAGHATFFQVRLRVGCAVKDPVAAVRRGVDDAAAALRRVLMDTMTEVSLRFTAHQADEARQAIRAALAEREKTAGFSPVFRLHDMQVELNLDKDTAEHLQAIAAAERATDRTAMGIQQQQRLETQRAAAERERDQLRYERDQARAEAEQERVRAEARVKLVEAEASAALELEKDRLEAERNRLRIEHEQVLVELERAKLDRQAMGDRLRAELDRERRWEDAALEARIERTKRQLELERTEQNTQLYLQAIASGDWQQLAVQLTRSDDPDVVAKLIGMVREERQADLDRQLATLKLLLEQDALEGAQLAQIASAGKHLLQRLITTWSQPAFPAPDAEHPTPTEDGNDARDLELIWERSLDVPSPWRIAVLLLLAVVVVKKLLPWAVRIIGGLVRLGVGPLVAVLLFPEYLLTSWCRGRGRPPLKGTQAYDDAVERTAELLRRTSRLAMSTLGRRRKISWGLVILIALVPAVLWYTERGLPDNRVTHPVVELVGSAQRPLLVADAWVLQMSGVDGTWNPEGCPEPPPKKPPKKPAKKKK